MAGVTLAAMPLRLLPAVLGGGGQAGVSPATHVVTSTAAAAAGGLVLDPVMVGCGVVCFAFPALASTIKVRGNRRFEFAKGRR